MRVETINEKDYERIFVMSDIHGYFKMFQRMWDKIKMSKRDMLIILGDSCDRGGESYELYRRYTELEKEGYNIRHLIGNHEDMMYNAIMTGDYNLWYMNGGDKTQRSFYKNLGWKKLFYSYAKWERNMEIANEKWFIEWLEKCPHIIQGKENIFVHAAYDTDKNFEEQEEHFVLWGREDFWTGNNTGKAIYFGHTPSKDGKIRHLENDVHCIDTGSYRNKIIACMEIKSKEEIYISQ